MENGNTDVQGPHNCTLGAFLFELGAQKSQLPCVGYQQEV